MAIVVLGLFQPRALIWCQAEAGHAALEALVAGCCGDARQEARCFPAFAGERSGAPGEVSGIGGEACRDVLVEVPAGLPLGERLSLLPQAVPGRCPVVTPAPPRQGATVSRRDDAARETAHELLASTVLRV